MLWRRGECCSLIKLALMKTGHKLIICGAVVHIRKCVNNDIWTFHYSYGNMQYIKKHGLVLLIINANAWVRFGPACFRSYMTVPYLGFSVHSGESGLTCSTSCNWNTYRLLHNYRYKRTSPYRTVVDQPAVFQHQTSDMQHPLKIYAIFYFSLI